jgi:hypothetical protein
MMAAEGGAALRTYLTNWRSQQGQPVRCLAKQEEREKLLLLMGDRPTVAWAKRIAES